MKGQKIVRPPLDPVFAYGRIADWRFSERISRDARRRTWFFRFTLFFENGQSKHRQSAHFSTKKEALAAREALQRSLALGDYIPFAVKTSSYMEYWLYYVRFDQISYNTFLCYRNCIFNYITPVIGHLLLAELKESDVSEVLNQDVPPTVRRHIRCVLTLSLKYAVKAGFCPRDVYTFPVFMDKKKRRLEEGPTRRDIPVLSLADASRLLYVEKLHFPDAYLPTLIAITTGMRISEIRGLKFSDIDVRRKTLSVRRQLGRSLNSEGLPAGEFHLSELKPKTEGSRREIHLPDVLLEEILCARARHEQNRASMEFFDRDYVCFRADGKPVTQARLHHEFHAALAACGLPPMRFHDLRHSYATILERHGVSMKAIQLSLGHYSSQFTYEVYVEKEQKLLRLDTSMRRVIPELFPTQPRTAALTLSGMEEVARELGLMAEHCSM